jgi:hypothetical protein
MPCDRGATHRLSVPRPHRGCGQPGARSAGLRPCRCRRGSASRDVLVSAADPAEAVRQLIALADEAGGTDNVTVIVIDVQVADAAASQPSQSLSARHPPRSCQVVGAGWSGQGRAADSSRCRSASSLAGIRGWWYSVHATRRYLLIPHRSPSGSTDQASRTCGTDRPVPVSVGYSIGRYRRPAPKD